MCTKLRTVLLKEYSLASGRRVNLTSCKVVALLVGRHIPGPGVAADDADGAPELVWLLAADVMLKPFHPMWRKMKPDGGSAGFELSLSEDGAHLASPDDTIFLPTMGRASRDGRLVSSSPQLASGLLCFLKHSTLVHCSALCSHEGFGCGL